MTRVSMEGVPDFDKFEIVRKGKVTLASPNSAGSSTNVSVTHSLGYQPLVMAFVAFSSTGTKFPIPYMSVNVPTTGTIRYMVSMEVVGNNIITFYHTDITDPSNVTDYITWYILREKSN